MPEPFNYQLQIPSMFERISQLQNIDVQNEQMKAFRQDREMKLAAQNMAIDQQRRQNAMIENLMKNPNPTVRDFSMVSMLMPKDRAEAIQKSAEAIDADTQKKHLLFGGQVMAALTAGKPEIAIQFLDERAKSEINAGRDGRMWDTYSKLIAVDPDKGMKTFGVMLASVPGGDKVLDSALKAQKGPSEIAKSESEATEAEVKAGLAPQKIAGEIALLKEQTKNLSEQRKIDQDKLFTATQLELEKLNKKATDLDPEAKKIVNNLTMESIAAQQSAGNMMDLRSRILKAGGGAGVGSSIEKWFQTTFGREYNWGQIRQEYTRLKNAKVIEVMPKGQASDNDVRIFSAGFPEGNADANYLAEFLRVMSNVSAVESKLKAAQADWVNASGSLGRTKKDINVEGVMVPANTSFNEFMPIFLDKEKKKLDTKAAVDQVKPKSYYKVWVQ